MDSDIGAARGLNADVALGLCCLFQVSSALCPLGCSHRNAWSILPVIIVNWSRSFVHFTLSCSLPITLTSTTLTPSLRPSASASLHNYALPFHSPVEMSGLRSPQTPRSTASSPSPKPSFDTDLLRTYVKKLLQSTLQTSTWPEPRERDRVKSWMKEIGERVKERMIGVYFFSSFNKPLYMKKFGIFTTSRPYIYRDPAEWFVSDRSFWRISARLLDSS